MRRASVASSGHAAVRSRSRSVSVSRSRSGLVKMAGSDDGAVAFGSALGEVAVEEVEAAGVAEFLDLMKQPHHRDGRILSAAGAQGHGRLRGPTGIWGGIRPAPREQLDTHVPSFKAQVTHCLPFAQL